MTLSFRSRLTLWWLLAFGCVLALGHVAVYVGARTFLQRDLDAQLRTLAGTELASAVDEPGQGVHLHEFPIDSSNAQDYADKFVQLIDARGRVLIQSPQLHKTGALVDAATLADALSGVAPVIDVAVDGRPGRMIGLATRGPERYVVAVGLFSDKLESTLRQLAILLTSVWVVGIGLTAIVGFSLASRALVPIRRITQRAASIAEGQFANRLDEPLVDDEIGQMTRLLNRMLDRLRGAIDANRRFASDASHELRGPLTAMLGEIDVTLKRERSDDEYRETLALLRERLNVMHRLTEDLMLLVRAQEGNAPVVGEVRVARVIEKVVDRAVGAARASRVSIAVDVPEDMVVYGDAALLERVFDNLVANGIQYNHELGSVTVTAGVRPSAGSWTADSVWIRVRNTGSGIPEAERERVFERFHRLDPSRSRRTGGSGLGLAISREIVHLFRGTIRIVDSPADGTTVEVNLPGETGAA